MIVHLIWWNTSGDREEHDVEVDAPSPEQAVMAAYEKHLIGMYMYDPDPSATAIVDGREFEIEPYTRAHVLPAKLDDRCRADPSSPIVPGYRCPCDECQRGVGDLAPVWKANP